jgi:hypothetical protein
MDCAIGSLAAHFWNVLLRSIRFRHSKKRA